MLPTIYILDSSAPSRVAILLLPAPAVKSKSLSPSITNRFISLGISMSKLRVPATKWAKRIPFFLVTMAAARVDARSSTTRTTSVGWPCRYLSKADIACPVSSFRLSQSTPRYTCGGASCKSSKSEPSNVESSSHPAYTN